MASISQVAASEEPPEAGRLAIFQPIGGTAVETTETIFVEACGTYLDSRHNYVERSERRKRFLDMRATISLVCRHWRNIVKDSGALWSSYVLRQFKERQPMLLWMSRMRAYPVHLHLLEAVNPRDAVDRVDVEELIQLLLSKSEKCETLTLLTSDNAFAMWLYLGLAPGVFPRLQRLVLKCTGSTNAWACTFEASLNAPMLDDLRLVDFGYRWYRPGSLKQLTTLVMRGGAATTADIAAALRDCPTLERLCLCGVNSYDSFGANLSVALPNLCVLHLELQGSDTIAQLIGKMLTPALKELSLTLDNGYDVELLLQSSHLLAVPTTLCLRARYLEPEQLRALYDVAKAVTCLDLSASGRECWTSIDRESSLWKRLQSVRLRNMGFLDLKILVEGRETMFNRVGVWYARGLSITDEEAEWLKERVVKFVVEASPWDGWWW
ncbi:hypothetical protein K438DRAFT_1984143 [Mycena galopus ATCC 62051]|nr:hypothetical protein K438DRAFT_1984143 [Mycena galopus ATCC 62051]